MYERRRCDAHRGCVMILTRKLCRGPRHANGRGPPRRIRCRADTPDGEPVMPKIREALAFWGRCLSDAERAFTEPAISSPRLSFREPDHTSFASLRKSV